METLETDILTGLGYPSLCDDETRRAKTDLAVVHSRRAGWNACSRWWVNPHRGT